MSMLESMRPLVVAGKNASMNIIGEFTNDVELAFFDENYFQFMTTGTCWPTSIPRGDKRRGQILKAVTLYGFKDRVAATTQVIANEIPAVVVEKLYSLLKENIEQAVEETLKLADGDDIGARMYDDAFQSALLRDCRVDLVKLIRDNVVADNLDEEMSKLNKGLAELSKLEDFNACLCKLDVAPKPGVDERELMLSVSSIILEATWAAMAARGLSNGLIGLQYKVSKELISYLI